MGVGGEEADDTLTVEELVGLVPAGQGAEPAVETGAGDDPGGGGGDGGGGRRADRVEVDRDTVDFSRLIAWVRRQDPVRMTLLAICVVWSLVFISLGVIRHNRFATFSFDLAIYDQGIWLLSRFRSFDTVKGIQLFGHHVNFVLIPFVPFYWLGAGPIFLLVVQVLAQASGAVAIYLLARDRFRALAPATVAGADGSPHEVAGSASDGDRWLAVGLAAVLLLNPTYQYLTWEFFHPDALAISPLLFAYWAASVRRWRWFAVAAVLAVACKEDVALPMAVIGVLIYLRSDRRIGMITAAASVAWFVVSTRFLMPLWLGGLRPFYDSYFGDFGNSAGEVVRNVASRPSKAWDLATAKDRVSYYRMMFLPVAFVPFASPGTLMIAVPMLTVNVLTSFPYAREIRYHYAALVLAGIILATVEGVARMGANPGFRRFLVGLLAATSLATTVAWGPSPMSVKYRSGLWPLTEDARNVTKRQAVDVVPADASVAASYYFVPHMAHRTHIYDFPEPWKAINWGIRGENLHDPGSVEWIVVDRLLFSDYDRQLFDVLVADEFTVHLDKDDIVVAQRTRPGGTIDVETVGVDAEGNQLPR